MSKPQKSKAASVDLLAWLEWMVLIVAGLLLLWLHGEKMRHAGALWRDEVNSVNIALSPRFSDLWTLMRYDSFPVLWFLVLRFWGMIGLGSDFGFQLLGFVVGIGLITSTFFALRLLKCERPLLAIVLIGFNATILDWGDSLRAWGLGASLIVLTLALIWKVTEQISARTISLATISALLSVHCIYYNSLLLFATCCAGALVCARRKAWKGCLVILGIGLVAALSLLPYLSTMSAVKENQVLLEMPGLKFSWLTDMLIEALAASGNLIPWIWGASLVPAVAIAMVNLFSRKMATAREQQDLATFALTALAVGIASYFLFLKNLKYLTSHWYYIALMAFVAVGMEMILGLFLQRKSYRFIRMAVSVILIAVTYPNLSKVVKERRTNVDVIAAELGCLAGKDDFIVINSWFYAVPFERYFKGAATWVTIPPISDHRVHRYDLVKEQMLRADQSEILKPVFEKMETTLKHGHYVWIVGGANFLEPGTEPRILPPAPQSEYGWREAAYSDGWSKQLGFFLQTKANQGGRMPIPEIGPVSRLEDLPVIAVQGWR